MGEAVKACDVRKCGWRGASTYLIGHFFRFLTSLATSTKEGTEEKVVGGGWREARRVVLRRQGVLFMWWLVGEVVLGRRRRLSLECKQVGRVGKKGSHLSGFGRDSTLGQGQ